MCIFIVFPPTLGYSQFLVPPQNDQHPNTLHKKWVFSYCHLWDMEAKVWSFLKKNVSWKDQATETIILLLTSGVSRIEKKNVLCKETCVLCSCLCSVCKRRIYLPRIKRGESKFNGKLCTSYLIISNY